MDAGRTDQGQRLHQPGIAHRDLERDPASERVSGEMDGRQPERIEKVEIKVCEVVNGLEPGRRGRCAKAWMFGDPDVELLGEHARESKRGRSAILAVQVNQRLAAAAAMQPDLRAVDLDVGTADVRHRGRLLSDCETRLRVPPWQAVRSP